MLWARGGVLNLPPVAIPAVGGRFRGRPACLHRGPWHSHPAACQRATAAWPGVTPVSPRTAGGSPSSARHLGGGWHRPSPRIPRGCPHILPCTTPPPSRPPARRGTAGCTLSQTWRILNKKPVPPPPLAPPPCAARLGGEGKVSRYARGSTAEPEPAAPSPPPRLPKPTEDPLHPTVSPLTPKAGGFPAPPTSGRSEQKIKPKPQRNLPTPPRPK